MASGPAEFTLRTIEAADTIRAARRRHAFAHAVADFVDLLATLPDHPAADFPDAELGRVRMLAEDVILQIEARAAGEAGQSAAAVELVSLVYAIRSRLEQIDIWRRHFG